MASISTTRAAIKAAVSAVVRCYDYTPSNLPVPCAIVGFPSRYMPNDTFGDTAAFTIPVSIYVAYGTDRAAEDNLEAYLTSSGAGSVLAAIDAIGSNYAASTVRDFGVLEAPNGQAYALGCVIDVDVWT